MTYPPGAGVPFGEGNITEWPLDGGALELELHHHWTYVFINAGLGNGTTDFNITLTPDLWNTTGSGTLCIDKLPIPEGSGVTNGALGTLQVITVDGSGSSLYNCADVRFVQNATAPSCNGTVGVNHIVGNSSTEHEGTGDHGDGHGDHGSGSDNSSESSGGDGEGAAGVVSANMVSLTAFAGLAAVFAMGLGL